MLINKLSLSRDECQNHDGLLRYRTRGRFLMHDCGSGSAICIIIALQFKTVN